MNRSIHSPAPTRPHRHRAAAGVLVGMLLACRSTGPSANEVGSRGVSVTAGPVTVVSSVAPGPSRAAARDAGPAVMPVLTVDELDKQLSKDACPQTMAIVRGGWFWMGSSRGRGAPEERPRFRTRVADYCLDTYEVTVSQYTACMEAGTCSPPHGTQKTCNYGRRDNHPINCVDWDQAAAYCTAQGARLPTELEWEYAARGGDKYFRYSWGEEEPDGRTCWKTNKSCPVGSFAPGAFGLHDMSGNVWEWTGDWFGDYPWPHKEGRARVLRGGSWSRRFDKWMRTTLRNRLKPEGWGSHLGFRCARLVDPPDCPFGTSDQPGVCQRGVVEAECDDRRQEFNGVRCAPKGATQCPTGHEAVPGYGCVYGEGETPPAKASASESAEEAPPSQTRSPEFDADCQKNQPDKPTAYRLSGASHVGRNRFGAARGCKNRDVGVGWNSVCCP